MKNLFSLGVLSLAFSPLAIAVATDLEKTTQPVATNVTQSFTQAGVPSKVGEAVSVLNDDAEKALKSLLANIESLSASFTQQIVDSEEELIQEGEGEFTIAKPNLLNWSTVTPEESTITADGETIWLYDPFIEQATAYSLHRSIANTPLLLLTSTDQSLWQQFNVEPVSAETKSETESLADDSDGHSVIKEFDVVSKDENAQVQRLRLTFDGEMLVKFSLLDATGQRSDFSLSNIALNKAVNESLFNFVLPEGALLDDQR